MTREEAAGVIKFEKACVLRQDTPRCNRDCKKCDLLLPTEDVLTAYDMAIKALEQEPCEDAISRQAAIDACLSGWNKDYKEIVEEIRTLPPVTPKCKSEDVAIAFQLGLAFGFGEKYDEMDKLMEEVKKAVTPKPKMGRWIDKDGISDFMYCSNCGGKKHYSEKWIGCPYCLADMRESYKEESEDK